MLDPSKPAHARASQRLASERIAWLTTVRADGQAQSSPVWFLWDGETFLVYSQPGAQKVRNLAANAKVSLHLGDDGAGDDIVTVEGTAAVEPDTPRAAARGLPGQDQAAIEPGLGRAVRPHLLDRHPVARPASGPGERALA